ncbi:hybrid sensor histidine kinase/response regulator transcription factor [Maribellus sediminis]|uniref:hybrid sensor histidine kinase/response regulator transcription factor n=1 Tax=Maribellus sediminis TaxID=2696285 RepID=UPI001431B500|nr:hybrid sensor histidine kinase/response regulator transcription factor [Maribellus sediminis]
MRSSIKWIFLILLLLNNFAGFSNSGRLTFIHYTNEDGLPSSYIKSICQDQYGFIWAATRSSVCRFDGRNFKTFQAVDKNGNAFDIWSKQIFLLHDSVLIAQTTTNDYYSFNFELERFELNQMLAQLDTVLNVVPSQNGLWIFGNSEVKFLDSRKNSLKPFGDELPFARLPQNASVVNVREKNDMLVALTSQRHLFVFDLKQKQQREIHVPDGLQSTALEHFYLDNSNNLWMGTTGNGLFRINLLNGNVQRFTAQQTGKFRLLHNLVHTITEDQMNRVWIGTEDGLCVWSPYTESFEYYQYDINNPEGLNTNPIYNVFADRQGNMWLGTYFGGINLWSNSSNFFRVWQTGTSENHISGSAVSCITENLNGNIWIGMEDMGINRIDGESGQITKVINESNGLSFNNVHDLLFETPDKLWIATYTGGINIYNLKTNSFEYINTENHPNLPTNNIYNLLQVGDSIFIASTGGVAVYNLKNDHITRINEPQLAVIPVDYMFEGANKIWFSSYLGTFFYDKHQHKFGQFDKFLHLKNINFVKTDSKNRVWAGDCLQGLWAYDYATDSLFHYNEQNGFPFSWIFSLEEGNDGSLWASGDKGLVHFNPETGEQVWYNRESGLSFEQFNYRASYKDHAGNIYFGGNNGLVSFNENNHHDENKALDVVFTGMQLFNQPLIPGTNSALRKSLNVDPEVNFKYKENVFTIEYSGLYFQNRGNCQYAYYLENFEENWNYVGNRDFATYTNLSPGVYYFHVKASIDNTQWGDEFKTVKIVIEPPFWLSNWGFLIYTLVFILLLFTFFMVTTRIQKSKAMAEMERREKEYISQINNFKLEFFTNISHELRTPLTLILGPITRIIQEEKLTPALSKKMKGIKNNAQRLLSLINQLLEFRKIESGKEKLQVSHQNLTAFLENVEESFAESAGMKGVQLHFEKINMDESIWIDCRKYEYIFVNILSNALKFTPKGGSVKVRAELINDVASTNKIFQTSISDTGIGIESSKLNRIFDRFYSVDTSETSNNTGSGIGLAFVKSLVKLHKGTITAESKPGKGSVFTVSIPVSRSDYKNKEIVLGEGQYLPHLDAIENVRLYPAVNHEQESLSKQSLILVIDDNRELLDFISETLSEEFKVLTAIDGNEALEMLEKNVPDLIISDVMMPGIDGFELARKLKTDINTSHIPIVLLTAKSGQENEYEGLQTGADYFIEKPFLPHMLQQQVQNVLNTRKNLIKRFKTDTNILPTDMASSESDKILIEKITYLILKNIDYNELDVSFLVQEAGISRSLLHTKLKKLTGFSATEFIRSIRLKEAVKLIADGKCNISEAAFQTGFSSPAYFSRRFKEYFGVSPTDYFNQ